MKKVFKRAIPFVLVVVMCLCMAAPAFALSESTTLPLAMRRFPQQSTGSYSTKYVYLIQQMVKNLNEDVRSQIESSGGVDGVFGSATYSGVLEFQSRFTTLTNDGIVGENTWETMGSILSRKDYPNVTYGLGTAYSNPGIIMYVTNIYTTTDGYIVGSSSQWRTIGNSGWTSYAYFP